MTPTHAPAWTDLGGGVRVRQSRAFMMNSGLLLDAKHTLVIDPGVLEAEIDELAAATKESGAAETTLFLTHAHWDHVLGAPWWPGASSIAHDRFTAELKAGEARTLAEAQRVAAEFESTWTRGFKAFKPGHAVSGLHYTTRGPWHLVFRDAPGHSDSQLSLHLPERKLLFAADMLSDVEIPILNRDPATYRKTLEPLRQLAESGAIETLVPGHGSIARDRDAVLLRVREDLDYLDTLMERATAEVRASRDLEATQASLESMEYRGKHDGPFPMAEVHRENVRFAWTAAKTPKRR